MSLQVWLPLTKDLRQQGLSSSTVTNNGATYSSSGGKLGGVYTFDGTDDYISGTYTAGVNISFAAWIYLPTLPGGKHIFDARTSGGTGYQPMYLTNSQIQIGGSGSAYANISYTWAANTWYHICVTHNASEGKCYINGELIGTSTTAKGASMGTCNFTLGSRCNQGNYSNVKMNDVRIYDHCLSSMEVKWLAQGLVLHYPLNRQGWGQENLYGYGSDCTSVSGFNQSTNQFSITTEDGQTCAHVTGALQTTAYLGSKIAFTPEPNQAMTFSAWVKLKNIVRGTTNPMCGFYFGGQTIDGSWRGATRVYLTVDGVEYSVDQAAWDRAISDTNWHKVVCCAQFGNYTFTNNLSAYVYFRDCTGDLYVHHIKYEKGTIATPWCPNSSDTLATTMGLNSTTEYDCSGFCNNGTKSGVTYSSDTPKYSVSTVFDANTPSTIIVPNANYAIQGSQAMTWSIWAYDDDWTTYSGRIYSCTEGGGVNIESANSGANLNWAVNMYTAADQSTYAYQGYCSLAVSTLTAGWHMFTWVYTTSGTKVYVDGVQKATYNIASYGLHFHTSAPLVLGGEASSTGAASPYLTGKLSDFRIYATALSADDVKSLYQNCATIDPDGTIRGQIRS